jgi:putative phosphoesterase
MLIGIISDSHDNLPLLKKAVDYCNAVHVDRVLHAGDFISPFCAKELKRLTAPVFAVFGNNDGERAVWRQSSNGWLTLNEHHYEEEWEHQKLLMMHVPEHIEALAISQQYDVIVYGHTHQPEIRKVGKTLIVNPGECAGWLTGKSTIALLRLPEKEVEIIQF